MTVSKLAGDRGGPLREDAALPAQRQIAPATSSEGAAGAGIPQEALSSTERAAAYRTACRFFRGFELLPAAVLESIHGFPEAFVERTGPLHMPDRERIAHAVTGEPLAAFGGEEPERADPTAGFGAPPSAGETASRVADRSRAIADFVRSILERWRPIRFEDVEAMLAVGFDLAAVREVAELAIDFHVIYRLTSALTVSLPGAFAVVPWSKTAGAARGRRAGRTSASSDEDEDQALVVLPALPEKRAWRASASAC